MRSFLVEFEGRRREVRRYLAVLVRAERELLRSGNRRHDREMHVLRAAALLVLYNTVEAAARGGIQAIYDEIEVTATPFDELCEPLKKRILRDLRTNVGGDRIVAMREVVRDMVGLSFDPKRLFGGNVDARELRSQSEDYGFDIVADGRLTGMGGDLLAIKEKRNDLAHGVASFSEVGRDYTAARVREIAFRSLGYVEAMLLSIDRYLTARAFLAARPGP